MNIKIQFKIHEEIQEFKRMSRKKKDRRAPMKMLKYKIPSYFSNKSVLCKHKDKTKCRKLKLKASALILSLIVVLKYVHSATNLK